MDLTPDNKEYIDSLSLEELLSKWRFSETGNPWFQGETGDYWSRALSAKRDENPQSFTGLSKKIGWG